MYIYGCNTDPEADDDALYDALNWLLAQGVLVINISMYRNNNLHGVYDTVCAYFDFIISNHCVSIVGSAGNGNGNGYITCPGIALNMITVGSINSEKKVAYDSAYIEKNSHSHIFKPNLVAPGVNIFIEGMGCNSGTSFAAPFVTGLIALLLEEFPILAYYPDTITATLMAGADALPSQSDILSDRVGAGLINYEKTRLILSSGYYRQYSVNEENFDNSRVGVFSVSIPANSYVDIAFSNVVWSNRNSIFSDVEINTSFTLFKLEVCDINYNYIDTVFSNNGNINKGRFYNLNSEETTYIFEFYINGESSESDYQAVSIAYCIN